MGWPVGHPTAVAYIILSEHSVMLLMYKSLAFTSAFIVHFKYLLTFHSLVFFGSFIVSANEEKREKKRCFIFDLVWLMGVGEVKYDLYLVWKNSSGAGLFELLGKSGFCRI